MEQKILQISKESIPAIQVEVILNELKDAERNRERVRFLTEQATRDKEIIEKQLKRIGRLCADLDIFKVREEFIVKQENEIVADTVQRAVDIQELKGAIEKVNIVKEMFKIVFANTQIKRQIYGQVPVPWAE